MFFSVEESVLLPLSSSDSLISITCPMKVLSEIIRRDFALEATHTDAHTGHTHAKETCVRIHKEDQPLDLR